MWHIQKHVSEVITKLQQLVIEDKVETCYIYAMIKILIQGLKEKLSGGIRCSHPILYHPSHTIFFSHFFKVVLLLCLKGPKLTFMSLMILEKYLLFSDDILI